VLRTDKKDKKDNHIFHWEAGDRDDTERDFAAADVRVKQDIYLPRIHVASIETCGCIADFDKAMGKLTVYMTTQAPHAIRTVFALVAGHVGLSEERIRIISPDLGGGFGGKVPVYPGYVIAVAASVLIGKPVKWIEDRMENLQADSFARDYHMTAELAAWKDGTITGLRIKTVADHGYADAAANLVEVPAGLFSICTGSYDIKHAFTELDGVYTNKPPGGVAYRCSFRVTEAVHAIERMADVLALELKMDPAQLRMKNFIPPEKFPYKSALGWTYDSGNYGAALRKAMDMLGYDALRKEQAEKRQRGELMGIGISSFTEIVGADPRRISTSSASRCSIRPRSACTRTGKAIARFGTKSQGQGHETTYAQIVAEELGIPAADIAVEEGDTDTAPYGLGTYASRSTPTAGAAGAMAARKIRDKARKIAAHLLEVSEEDLEWEPGKFSVKGAPQKAKTIQEIAFAAYTNHPQGMEAGLEATSYYDPPNLTFPFGSYICVVDIDRGTGMVKVRRFVAVDDCGNIINPMIVDGQIHGGLSMGLAPALFEEISYDENGNNLAEASWTTRCPPRWRRPSGRRTRRDAVAAPPAGREGRASRRRSAPPAIVNAVVDALAHLGVAHDIPITPEKVWRILGRRGGRVDRR
jgi:carbon-monoxide dehydrogenase large subunit